MKVILAGGSVAALLLVVATYVTVPASAQLAPAAERANATTQAGDRENVSAGAKTPEEAIRAMGRMIKAKDVDGVLAIHEREAALVERDGPIIRGMGNIRKFYEDWFKTDPVLTVNARSTVISGGKRTGDGKVRGRTAVTLGDYVLEQNAPDGNRVKYTGYFNNTLHEQPNGTWLYIQDNPYPPIP
ncbi:YybH family protein [Streptomyces sp. NPDC057555]|uniref:YybH family protein n=1 Tax=Streptomyces sp. NPDC057555 TaxID=3346166 RepID=UPI003680E617